MSVRVMSLVWDSNVRAPERFTLLALADRADEEGLCWPSRATLAKKCRTSESTIRKHIKTLEAEGVLHIQTRRIDDRHNDSNMYRIDLARLREMVDEGAAPTPKTSTESRPPSTESRPRVNLDPGSESGPPSADARPRGGPNQVGGWAESRTQSISDPPRDPSVIHQGTSRKRDRAPQASRIPEDFTVTPAMVAWASANVPHVDGRRETAKFIDHFRAASGTVARKTDWVAAWRNWMRKADERPTTVRSLPGAGRTPTTTQRVNDALALIRPEED